MGTIIEPNRQPPHTEPSALDIWVRRILADHYGHVASEPVPPEILRVLARVPPQH